MNVDRHHQKLLDLMMSCLLVYNRAVHVDANWVKDITQDKLAEWAVGQLNSCGYDITPMGSSYAYLRGEAARDKPMKTKLYSIYISSKDGILTVTPMKVTQEDNARYRVGTESYRKDIDINAIKTSDFTHISIEVTIDNETQIEHYKEAVLHVYKAAIEEKINSLKKAQV